VGVSCWHIMYATWVIILSRKMSTVPVACCLMTICNMLIHGCVGEVIHHDSLCPENFMDGWMVNHTLTQTGIPSIRRMSEEEYRTSRNMSVDLLRKRKEKLRQMQPDKKQLP